MGKNHASQYANFGSLLETEGNNNSKRVDMLALYIGSKTL